MSLADAINGILGWPLILYVIGICAVCTVALGFIQLRYFLYSWKLVLFPPAQKEGARADMTPFQAFVNTLSTNLGNGSLAGVATAVYAGGPGSAIWMVIIGLLLMSIRFAEVFLSVHYGALQTSGKETFGGPMLYLKYVAGGAVLAPAYAIFCLLFMAIGSAIQSNSISLSMATTWQIPYLLTAFVLLAFIVFVVYGGAARIVKVSQAIVPLKVGVFFISTGIVLIYHAAALPAALKLMLSMAFSTKALVGGALGFTVQQAMRYGILRSILATESGLGTAAIIFSSTGSTDAVKDGLISMLSTFISTLVCFIIALCIVVSGVWSNGLTSTALTISSFATVFGSFGGWVVSFLSISFGIGVLVAYAYITREAWLSVTKGRFAHVFPPLFCAVVFAGALISVDFVFYFADLINGGMLFINLFGIAYLLPVIIKSVRNFSK